MPSQARAAFEENRLDVERLLEIHTELSGDAPGRKYGVAVLNKAGIVLTCAVWEAFCEDLAAEALNHLVEHAQSPDELPQELRKQIARELAEKKHELAIWDLAGDGWRKHLLARLSELAEERNRKLNTPKRSNIEHLFSTAVGIGNVPGAWAWKAMNSHSAGEKLDTYVTLRGSLAHRAQAAESVKKTQVKDFLNHAERLVEKTDEYVSAQIEASCGQALF